MYNTPNYQPPSYMRFLLLVSLMITIAVGRAESPSLHELKAIDITTNCPIPYHTLRLHPHNKVILANEDGSVFIDTTQISSSDSLSISCLGYSPKTILIDSIKSINIPTIITLSPKIYQLQEVLVVPQLHFKEKTIGKKHSSGLANIPFQERKGSHIGFIVTNEKKQTWLKEVGFFINEHPNKLQAMNFRVTIYEFDKISGHQSSEFRPIIGSDFIIHYDETLISNNKFCFQLNNPILLPTHALIGLEFLDDMNGQIIPFRNNIFGKSIWSKSINSDFWVKLPIATPFFLKFLEQ